MPAYGLAYTNQIHEPVLGPRINACKQYSHVHNL